MTESEFNESTSVVFARIEQIANDSGVAIKRTLSGSALKLELPMASASLPTVTFRAIKSGWLADQSSIYCRSGFSPTKQVGLKPDLRIIFILKWKWNSAVITRG